MKQIKRGNIEFYLIYTDLLNIKLNFYTSLNKKKGKGYFILFLYI